MFIKKGTLQLLATLAGLSLGNSLLAQNRSAQWARPIPTSTTARVAAVRSLCGTATCQSQTLVLDPAALSQVLQLAPRETSRTPAPFDMPMADGSTERFLIVETAVLSPELAQLHPEIHTYRGVSAADPSTTIHLTFSGAGLQAMVLKKGETILMDPAGASSGFTHLVYKPSGGAQISCGVGMLPLTLAANPSPASATADFALPTSLTQLRAFRLALVLPTSYVAQASPATADGALALATGDVNRLSAVYERDMNVTFQLVQTATFVDAASQPFPVADESDTGKMLTQAQAVLSSSRITVPFDVGHLLAGAGGNSGVAASSSACDLASKASGSSVGRGTSTPVAWINLIAHEIGHQFGASHSYNASGAGVCTTREPSSAFETASGNTIMSYVGTCSGGSKGNGHIQDLQPNEDLMFHSYSLKQMLDFVNAPGQKAPACGLPALGTKINTPPSATTKPQIAIPARTAFYLDAVGTDPDAEDAANLTYAWEELDLGAANPTNEDDGSRPLFRGYLPVPTGRRYLPALSWVLKGVDKVPEFYKTADGAGGEGGEETKRFRVGEVVPTTSRTMRFRVTVRDNRKSDGVVAGAVGFAETNVQVVATAGPFRVTTPHGGETWAVDSTQTVTWDVSGTTAAPISADTVRIQYSLDGKTFSPIGDPVPNSGSATLTVPAAAAGVKVRIQIEGVSNPFFAVAAGDVAIK